MEHAGAVFPQERLLPSRWVHLRYNVATNSWFVPDGPTVHASDLNGAEKIGNKLYLTGGSTSGEDESNFPHIRNPTLAYNVSTQTLQREADMPMAGEGGISGNGQPRLFMPLQGNIPEEGPTTGHSYLYTP